MSDVHNPYAAPQTLVEPSAGATFDDGGPQPWESGEVIGEAWELFKQHWAPLIGALVVGYVILFGVQQVAGLFLAGVMQGAVSASGELNWGLFAASMAVSMTVSFAAQAAVMPGWVRLFLMAARRETPVFGVFFSSFGLFPKMVVAVLLNAVLIYAGMLLLIVPGVILGLGTCLFTFFVADGAGGVDALKASWEATKGQKGALFVFFLLIGLLNVGGMLACFVGMAVTLPVSFLAMAIVYTRITGRRAPRGWAAA